MIQYIGGDDVEKAAQSAILTSGLYDQCKKLVGIEKKHFFAVMAANTSSECQAAIRGVFHVFHNGSSPPILDLGDPDDLFRVVSNRMNWPRAESPTPRFSALLAEEQERAHVAQTADDSIVAVSQRRVKLDAAQVHAGASMNTLATIIAAVDDCNSAGSRIVQSLAKHGTLSRCELAEYLGSAEGMQQALEDLGRMHAITEVSGRVSLTAEGTTVARSPWMPWAEASRTSTR